MTIQIKNITDKYKIKKFTEGDITEIYELCKANTTYYSYMKMEPTLENLAEVLTELPPGKTLEDKYFIGFYMDDQLIALLDLCTGFPDDVAAYIGWFMVRKELHGTGVGSQIIGELLEFLKQQQFENVRLGCIEDNKEAKSFWQKMGFEFTGSKSDAGDYVVLGMQKKLNCQ